MSYPRLLAACVCMGALAQTPPAPVAEYANLGFAWRLHQELARSGSNENLVWSPLSLQSVLAVVAEGARGKTAAELGTCLGLPASARRSGDEERPWDFTVLHQANRAAVAALRAPWAAPDQVEARRLNEVAHGKPDRRTRGKMEELTTTGDDYRGPYQPFVFRSVDRLVVERDLPLEQDYLGSIRALYPEGTIERVDFKHGHEAERLRMNQWITRQTDGIIRDPISANAWKPGTRLAAVNVTYLRADWSHRFDPEKTQLDRFSALGERSILRVPMMSHVESCRYVAVNRDGSVFPTPGEVPAATRDEDPAYYPKEGGYHVIEKTYAGQRASMVLVLPTRFGRLADLEAALTPAHLEVILRDGKERYCFVKMPKFKTRTLISLPAPLARLGLSTLTDGFNANLTGIHVPVQPQDRLRMESLDQVTDIEVNEKGTVAVSVTFGAGIGGGGGAGPKTRPFVPQFIANQAFLYFIKDNETGQVLFIGRMTNPAR